MQIKNVPKKLESSTPAVYENSAVPASAPAGSFLGLQPQAMVSQAASVATILADIIKQQNLSVRIGGAAQPHVKHEGWATLGSLLGILPREKHVVEQPDGSYEAYVELYSVASGQIVGQGSGYCGMDETRWKSAPKFARRSMAITRATGKAYRLGFGWVMALAGYNPTPAEEMDHLDVTPAAPKAVTLFDKGNEKMATALASQLKAMGLPENSVEEMAKLLHGRPFNKTEIESILSAVDG